MDAFETINYTKADGVGRISLNRPRVLNAYNIEMRDDLYQVLGAVRDDPEVRVAILRGEGRAFCAGADLTEFGTAPSLAVARQVRWERDVWGSFLSVTKPLVAAIHGYCLGSGVEIALLCDIRIASIDAVFGLPEVSLGMIPAAGGTQTLPRTLGIARALELLLTRRRIGAAEALGMGMVTRMVEREHLEAEANATALRLAQLDPRAVEGVKQAVWQGLDLPLERALELEARLVLGASAGRSGRIIESKPVGGSV